MRDPSLQLDPEPRRIWMVICITMVAIVLFVLADKFYSQVTFAPLSGALLLFVLALIFRPQALFVSFLITCAYVVWSLLRLPSFSISSTEAVVRFVIRTLTFCVAGGVAVLASYFRCQLGQMLKQTKHLLAELPVGVVLSDSSGRIVWSNTAAHRMAGTRPPEGRPWVEVMPTDGTPIDYSRLFGSSEVEAQASRAFPDHVVKFVRIQAGHRRLLATVIIPQADLVHSPCISA